ncbi:MAG: peptidase family protein, partial [Bacteroidetes bacterium]|nr:peptidase family protein [Bacteroidota bacterium]
MMSRAITFIFITTTMFMQSAIGQSTAKISPVLPSDVYNVKEYTLKNGLKVFISVNRQTPRVQTMIAVKAGSKYDPAQTTGLAHYLEHMMFKGTQKYGTRDWAKESILLNTISNLYEKHLKETDEEKKKAIYHEIDSVSKLASDYAIPSEYDKMVASIGASGTNAFTSNDMTVYVNDIPSNAIDKWASLESERFSTLVLRLFHTELETVYEEFNRNQDDDIRWSSFAVDSMLMPNHPYGTQTTIGLGEHLKNPSMVNIHKYFDTYYNPNNIAIILCGDLDPDKAIADIEKHFGTWKTKDIPPFIKGAPVPLTHIQTAEIKGPTKEHVYLGYRLDGDGTKDALMAKMLDMILSNGTAGLIDVNINQKQKTLSASSYVQANKDYCVIKLYGEPKQGQTLEEVKDLLVSQIEAIRKGEFDEWLIAAVVQNLRLSKMKSKENNRAVASELMDAFVKDIPWAYKAGEIDALSKITKADIVKFANEKLKDNYAVCYKRAGEPNRHKVDKPKITPVTLNKDSVSTFKTAFDKVVTGNIKAKFVDFDKDMTVVRFTDGTPLRYVHNDLNKTFSLSYVYYKGTDDDKQSGPAIDYMSLLGTDKHSIGDLKKEFYKIGISYNVSVGRDRIIVKLSGLEDNLPKGLELLNELLTSAKADKVVYNSYVSDVLKKRANAKTNKGIILRDAMGNYAKYGPKNPFTNIMTEKELKDADPGKLLQDAKALVKFPSDVYYYGQRKIEDVKTLLGKNFASSPKDMEVREDEGAFPEQPLDKPTVYFCNYNMKQAEVIMMSKDEKFNKDLFPFITLYNDYYGSGLSSILFQEIREKMGLAYAVNSSISAPQYDYESHYINCYVGTQADKLETTMKQMNSLLNTMVQVPKQYEGARTSAEKTLESEWVTGEGIFGAYDRAKKRGLNYDIRKDMYAKIPTISMADLNAFFEKHIKGKP